VTGKSITPEMFKKVYAKILDGSEMWQGLPAPEGKLYDWDESSTYIQHPPFFQTT